MSIDPTIKTGPYTALSAVQKVEHEGVVYIVGIAGAFNACGLIGPECNGIFILDETHKQVILDEHAKISTGYFGANQYQTEEYNRIVKLPAAEFYDFVNTHARQRLNIPFKIVKPKALTIQQFIKMVDQDVGYKPEKKEVFLRECKRVLGQIAKKLGLKKGEFDLRVNQAGIACSGEVTLHSDTIYIQFSQSIPANGFMYRSCKGRKDFSGGRNCWMRWEELTNMPKAIQQFKAVMQPMFSVQ